MEPQSHPIRKRRRVPLACSICRDRKTRCDGGKPTCKTCDRKGLGENCFYEDGILQKQRHVSELKSKATDPEHNHDSGSIDAVQPGPSQLNFSSVQSPLPELAEEIDHGSIDALGTTSSTNKTDALYGGSSTVAFVSSIENVTTQRKGSRHARQQSSLSSSFSSPKNGQRIPGPERLPTSPPDSLLPDRHVADEFLSCYWRFVHPLFPILQKSTFHEPYQRLWDQSPRHAKSEELDGIVFMSTLKLMLALGCQFSPSILPADRSTRASEFYQQSRDILSFDILDSMHLSLVQLFLLTGVYLQSTKHADRCWNVVGLAIRIAHGLGLHVEQIDNTRSQLEVELRRRIWHTCIMLDRLLGMTFGRPPMIARNETTVRTPQLVEEEYPVNARNNHHSTQVPTLGLFVYSLKLYDILDTILATFYLKSDNSLSDRTQNSSHSSTAYLTEILKLNSDLDLFYENVPEYLKLAPSGLPSNEECKRDELQINILNCRFLYVRILLLRPLLFSQAKENIAPLKTTQNRTKNNLQSGIVNSACALCLRTAYELIGSLYDTLENPNRSAPWHCVYFVFSGAMIIVTSRLCSFDSSDTDETRLQDSWNKCLRILNYHKAQVQSAAQAISVLDQCWSRVAEMKPMHLFPDSGRQMINEPLHGPTTGHAEAAPTQPSFGQQQMVTPIPNPQAVPTSEHQVPIFNFMQQQQAPSWNGLGNMDSTSSQTALFDEQNPNIFSQADDQWFTQTFLESDLMNISWDEGGFFF